MSAWAKAVDEAAPIVRRLPDAGARRLEDMAGQCIASCPHESGTRIGGSLLGPAGHGPATVSQLTHRE